MTTKRRLRVPRRVRDLVSEKFGFLPRESRAQIERRVLKGFGKFGSQYNLAVWFARFANAKTESLKSFWTDARYLVSTRGALVRRKDLEGLALLQREVQKAIDLAVTPEPVVQAGKEVISSSGLRGKVETRWSTYVPAVPQHVTLTKMGDKIELVKLSPDFNAAILLLLFDLLCSHIPWFGRCPACGKIFARRGWGRQLYCSQSCLETKRTSRNRREYFAGYMRDRRKRAAMKELKKKAPDLFK